MAERVFGITRLKIYAGPLGPAFIDAVHDAAQAKEESLTGYVKGAVRQRMTGEGADSPEEGAYREISGRPPGKGRGRIDMMFHNPELVDAIKSAADAQGETLSDYIRRAVQIRMAKEGAAFPATFVIPKPGRKSS